MLPSDQIDASSPVYNQIKVPRNDGTNYADYLLSGVDTRCIYIDKNNRKWFGTTDNGLYIIDSDNITTLAHFTSDNSKLISDNVLSLAYNNLTSEFYIGTDKGLCSYTPNFANNDEGMTKDNVWAYPNPVHPDYSNNHHHRTGKWFIGQDCNKQRHAGQRRHIRERTIQMVWP